MDDNQTKYDVEDVIEYDGVRYLAQDVEPHELEIGDLLVVLSNEDECTGFEIGEVVRFRGLIDDGRAANAEHLDGRDYWTMEHEDYALLVPIAEEATA